MGREMDTTQPRLNIWRIRRYRYIFLLSISAKSKSKNVIVCVCVRETKSPVFHTDHKCACVFRLKERSWQSFWSCMTLCMIRPWAGSPPWKTIWRTKSSATLGSCLSKTLTHRWMFWTNHSHICSKSSFIVILPQTFLLHITPVFNFYIFFFFYYCSCLKQG